MCCEVTSAWYWCVQTWSYPGVYRSDAFCLTQGYNDQIRSCLRGSTIPRRYRAVRSGHTWWKSYLSLCSLSLTIVFLFIFNPAFTVDTSNDITPAIRVVAFMKKKRVLRKSFREVFYKYVWPGIGIGMTWRLCFGKDRREDVIHRLKDLLSWVDDAV